jgi:hypothetical protein
MQAKSEVVSARIRQVQLMPIIRRSILDFLMIHIYR